MKLYIVGTGAGNAGGMTLDARSAIQASDIVVGYTLYVELLRSIFPDKNYLSTGMKSESERVNLALSEAQNGKTVALICSGDSGVYGLAGLALELSENYTNIDIEIVPGVTAALSGGALLGAPLGHDFAVISLSDLLTPWEQIEERLEAAAKAGFVICLYNPSSKKRADYLQKACDIFLKYRRPDTICGFVKNIGREGETYQILPLEILRETAVDMFTTVYIGTEKTMELNGKMVTPRGYREMKKEKA